MSFIYDTDIFESIVSSAFPKYAQQTTSIDPIVVQRLADRLNSELSLAAGDKYTPNTPGQTGAELKYDDLKFDKLLKFLSSNKIKFGPADKDRIAFTKEEFIHALPSDLQEKDKENYDIVGDYYINAPALIDYINYLQGKLQEQNNPLINARLKLLSDEVNQNLPGANISRTPSNKNMPGTADFKDTDELDKLEVLFSPKYGVKEGPNSLTVGDLKNKESLNAWLQNHQAKIVTYDAKGTPLEELYIKAKDIKTAWETILKALYDRVSRLRDLATSQELVKKYDFYKRLLLNLGVSSGIEIAQSGATQNASYQNQQNGGSNSGDVDFNHIIDELPLGDDIDLFRINRFFDQLQKLYNSSNSRSGIINSYVDAAKNAINNLDNVTNNLKIVKENTLPKDFAYFLKGSTASYAPAINLLYAIVTNTRQAIATFYSDYATRLNDDQKNKMTNQTEFYYGKNRGLLNDLLRGANQVAR